LEISWHYCNSQPETYTEDALGIALEAGREYEVTLPVTALVEQMFGVLEAKGRGGWDHSALLTLIEEGSR
jgi:3-hydroxyisobutyrate dehydrogenase-like beta-hydroxyacid dehydrogenase